MATKFQIKRTSISGRTPNTADPANTSYIATGELALNLTDQKLFSSNGTVAFEVGSNVQFLTAEYITAGNSTVNTTINAIAIAVKGIVANGVYGSPGYVLLSNGTGVYWDTPPSSVNVNASYSWNNVHTFAANVTTNDTFIANGNALFNSNVTLGNNAADIIAFVGTVNTYIVPSANLTYSLGNNAFYWLEVHAGNVHADQGYFEYDVEVKRDLDVLGNTALGNTVVTGFVSIGNSTVNTTINSTSISVTNVVATNISGNGSGITDVDAATVGGNTASTLRTYSETKAGEAYSNATSFASNADNISSGTLNTARLPATVNVATAINIGTDVNLTTSTINIGNSTVNTAINSTAVALKSLVANGTVGSSGDVLFSNGTVAYWAPSGALGTNVDATFAWTNTHSFSNVITFGNSTVNTVINSSSIVVTKIIANGEVGTTGQVLTSNGSGVYWAAASGSSSTATITTYTYTISTNKTVIEGADDNAATLSYIIGRELVYLNGVKLVVGSDYSQTNTSAITLTSNAVSGDVVEVVAVDLPISTDLSTSAPYSSSDTNPLTIDTYALATYRTSKYYVQANTADSFHSSEAIVIHDGTTAYVSEYGMVYSNGSLYSLSVDINGGNVRLRATPTRSGTTFKSKRIVIEV